MTVFDSGLVVDSSKSSSEGVMGGGEEGFSECWSDASSSERAAVDIVDVDWSSSGRMMAGLAYVERGSA